MIVVKGVDNHVNRGSCPYLPIAVFVLALIVLIVVFPRLSGEIKRISLWYIGGYVCLMVGGFVVYVLVAYGLKLHEWLVGLSPTLGLSLIATSISVVFILSIISTALVGRRERLAPSQSGVSG